LPTGPRATRWCARSPLRPRCRAATTFVLVTFAERLARIVPRGTHDPTMFIRPRDLRRKLEKRGIRGGALRWNRSARIE
jgi:2-polyprenyl-3-methyl-5-hydroxy-6-metoxy-1,4-benzoquinol methylase